MEIKQPLTIKEKKKFGRPSKYTPQYYMVMAKQVYDEGITFREAAKRYHCSHGTVNYWVQLYKEGLLPAKIEKAEKLTPSAEQKVIRLEEQIRGLKAAIGDLYLENQLLKKIQAHFHQPENDKSFVITSENWDQFEGDVK